MNELQCLNYELDFADSPAAEFQVALHCVRSNHIALDSSFDFCNFVEQIWRWTTRINEGLMLAKKFVGQLAIPCDAAGFD